MTDIADVPAYDIPFDQSEYDDRLDRLRRAMEEQRLDGLILTEPSDIYYLSGYDTQGFWAYQAMIIPADGPLTLVCFVEEVLHAEARGLQHAGYAFGGDHIRMTVETVEKCGSGQRAHRRRHLGPLPPGRVCTTNWSGPSPPNWSTSPAWPRGSAWSSPLRRSRTSARRLPYPTR